ncbi:MSL complex subunit 3-like [Ptychodera flava]|uniref:MSL complex subunit 3-like n=1 Tax=Ptychodera flava TaxID=63121 RepID=UPI00396A79F6
MSSSTRGIKPQFSEGERVLCFEPDPTKAKVLYDSKVLEVDWTKDEKGRRVPEYLVHFNGWNHSWDRWAIEEYVLKDTEENRQLQEKLQKEAEEKMKKKKKKRKLSEIIAETKQKKAKQKKMEAPSESEEERANDSESTVENDSEPSEVPINIPDILKTRLEDDCYYITKKKQLVQLPIQPNVITLFESYLKHFALSVHISEKHRSQSSANVVHGLYANKFDGPPTVPPEHNVDLVKEILEDLRLIFDFALPLILLYGNERAQYTKLSTSTFLPVLPPKKGDEDDDNSTGDPEISFKNTGAQRSKQSQKRAPSPQTLTVEVSTTLKSFKKEKEAEETESVPPARRITRRQSTEQRLTDKSSTAPSSGSSPPTSRRRIEAKPTPAVAAAASAPQVSASPPPEKSLSTRQSTRHGQQSAPTPQNPPQNPPQIPQQSTGQSSAPHILQLSCSGRSRKGSNCSSARSTPGICEVSSCSWNLKDCTDVLSWRLLPSDFTYEGPTPPSLIYGAQHLLRLFVKLPEVLGRMQIPPKTLKTLVRHIDGIVKYLALPDNVEDLLPESAYMPAEEVYGNFKKS